MSVTIIYPDSALADIFSTAIFLLPLEDAIAYVNATQDLEAIWYDFDGTIHYSEGFDQYIYAFEN
jgi:thiamine biosynthesis lipoprotein